MERLLASLATERDTFTHDANRNQTRLNRTVTLDGTTTGTQETVLTYDYPNQLTHFRTSVPGGAITQEWENRYDAFGRRIARRNVQTGELIRFLYDGGRIIEERGENPETASPSNNEILAEYLFGPTYLDDRLQMRRLCPPPNTIPLANPTPTQHATNNRHVGSIRYDRSREIPRHTL
ncbi:MAG: hypothetical protein SFY68_03520 [Candidatus Sumerlaeia bacterium]|nr:hypothetical protein [Candidatus Sumerlaeia bacterium]